VKALIVDDDVDLLDLMTYALRREGYTVIAAIDGQQALERLEADRPDIVLLDANLPKINGFEVCRRIRHDQDSETPVIMMTARNEDDEVVRGLNLGADDYVTKPFSVKQLTARMKAVLRRCQSDPYRQAVSELKVGNLKLDLQSHEATKDDEIVQLTPLEFRILYMLAMNAGRVIPYSRLVEYAWGYEGGDSNLLKTHICHIRRKLDMPVDGSHGIRAVPGVGYSLARAS
jgi:DNA-binding response OmpR family regulator